MRYPIKPFLLATIASVVLTGCALFDSQSSLTERTVSITEPPSHELSLPNQFQQDTITVASLNLAHGRKNHFSQLLLGAETIESNLNDIADYLLSTQPDIVALQEADGPSNWSGNFNHVTYLGAQAQYPSQLLAPHVKNLLGLYGTGMLSKARPQEGFAVTFQPSPPTPRKGFTLASYHWKTTHNQPLTLDVISVHLDFSRESVRITQIQDIKATLKSRNNPTVILGDFNSEWAARVFTVEQLSHLGLRSYRPNSKSLNSYNSKRLDWVLISHHLEFVHYRVDDIILSDHRPVLATIKPALTTIPLASRQ